jgi:hypothetical protein
LLEYELIVNYINKMLKKNLKEISEVKIELIETKLVD